MNCTCNWPAIGYPHPRFGYDPDCPQHGTDAMLAQADPTLDIDEPPREEAAEWPAAE